MAENAAVCGAWTGKDLPAALRGAIDPAILDIDRLIAAQLDAILHHPRVQALEGRWRGLRWLVDGIEDGPGDRTVVRLLNVTWLEITRDMERSNEFDRSHLYRMVCETAFGTAGGEPFGLLLMDHAVHHPLRPLPENPRPPDHRPAAPGRRDPAGAAHLAYRLRQPQHPGDGRDTCRPSAVRCLGPVTELPDKPGAFACAIILQPYFQLDNVTASFGFATEIVATAS